MAVDELAFDLEADEQEEQSHQPVIDPMMNREWPKFALEQFEISGTRGTVGDDQRKCRSQHQQHATGRLTIEEGAKRGARASIGHVGSLQYIAEKSGVPKWRT